MIKDESKFRDFLVRAKQNTYAGDGKESSPSRPKSKDLMYREFEYAYIDTYLGSFNFIGEEAVWFEGDPIWGMNYYGKMLIDEVPDGFSKCLKGALKNVPFDSPYRGPEHFKYDRFEYKCRWKGDINSFSGDEEIFMDGEVIYRLKFHGGTLR
jgi:hypothetical protein